ncbi:hypothetical protein D9619_011087 [Psilocybe cf. subviscida]|uniref:Uncharacterized protein n=1 Tax=Psilocybe cf. subviscida TaxID=2480587 RepID=A0A8H5BLH7_9AGAR|nr:hypothetical protein D9619_011087 [Psilocybe cf. subviscida]
MVECINLRDTPETTASFIIDCDFSIRRAWSGRCEVESIVVSLSLDAYDSPVAAVTKDMGALFCPAFPPLVGPPYYPLMVRAAPRQDPAFGFLGVETVRQHNCRPSVVRHSSGTQVSPTNSEHRGELLDVTSPSTRIRGQI